MRIKVLPLESWMEWDFTLENCLEGGRYTPVPVRFNRPGIYLEGTLSWFELENGCAYSYPTDQFQYTLKMHDALRLDPQQVRALKDIVAARLASRRQRELLTNHLNAMATREVYRNSRKHALRFLNSRPNRS